MTEVTNIIILDIDLNALIRHRVLKAAEPSVLTPSALTARPTPYTNLVEVFLAISHALVTGNILGNTWVIRLHPMLG